MGMSYQVHVLSDGYSRLDGEGSMLANCTCTLIKGPKNVIVDTMTPWDGQVIVAGLGKHGLKPVLHCRAIIFGIQWGSEI